MTRVVFEATSLLQLVVQGTGWLDQVSRCSAAASLFSSPAASAAAI